MTKRIEGHIDHIDDTSLQGWAVDHGARKATTIELYFAGRRLRVPIKRRQRPDVASAHGAYALHSGFDIDLTTISPRGRRQVADFFLKFQVLADGQSLPLLGDDASFESLRPHRPDDHAWSAAVETVTGTSLHEHCIRFIEPARSAARHGADLRLVLDRTRHIRPDDIIVFATVRNEADRVPYFLRHYRDMGVSHFIFVDNGSSDGFSDLIAHEPDCSMWFTDASYREANFGVHWINYLLNTYGQSHWCLTVDLDELLVFPHYETRNLVELVEFLEAEGRDHLFCLLLDMYSDQRISDALYRPHQDPLQIAPYFDGTGYTQYDDKNFGEIFIQGGVRRRVFFREHPQDAPALNKTPLVKWQLGYNYLSSTHMIAPREANRPHAGSHLCPTGCLLHFKFLSLVMRKIDEEMHRREHFDNSKEYNKYHQLFSEGVNLFINSNSLKYSGSRQLCDLGFMSCGRWF